MANISAPEKLNELPIVMLKNFITLATGGLGVAVALAWNETIKGFVQKYIDPYFGANGTVVSLFIYALIITSIAVIVTMQLTQIEKKLIQLDERVLKRKAAAKIAAKKETKKTKSKKKKK
jgi:hypothetical protein